MIPFSDSMRTRQTPWVNWALIAACILVFFFELTLGPRVDRFIQQWGVVPADVSGLFGHGFSGDMTPLITLFSAQFLHAGWLHLGGNMLFLWIFGDNVEDRLGHLSYLVFYLICGAIANLVQVFVMPGTEAPLIGASGAIAAVLGSYLITYPRAWVSVFVPVFFFLVPLEVPVIIVLGFWFISQLGSGLVSITEVAQAADSVAWWAHLGGFVLGIALTMVWPKSRRSKSSLSAVAPRVAASRAMPLVPRVVVRLLTVVGDGIRLLIILRIIVRFFEFGTEGPLGALVQLVYTSTGPLVRPFAPYLPAVEVGSFTLELWSILALVAYHVLFTIAIWALLVLFKGGHRPRAYN